MAVWVALTLPILLASAAFAIDLANASLVSNKLSGDVEAAAQAGVISLDFQNSRAGVSDAQALATAKGIAVQSLTQNEWANASSAIVSDVTASGQNNNDYKDYKDYYGERGNYSSNTTPCTAIKVTFGQTIKTYFAKIIGFNELTTQRSATAIFHNYTKDQDCLSPTGSKDFGDNSIEIVY
ncbi:MAG: hypothetical protein F2792_02875 [Actinobacteria bacterium]|nr:hypothetical protein [Actinomycetota bacterium]